MVKISTKHELNNVKQEKEIEIKRNRNFQGELVIEGYSKLEKLYLQDVRKVDKITLKNLKRLQECTIWNCDTNDLVIDNCSQIKKLNVRQNNLTSLEFLRNLDNLEELEIDGNTKLIEILGPLLRKIEILKKEKEELLKEKNSPKSRNLNWVRNLFKNNSFKQQLEDILDNFRQTDLKIFMGLKKEELHVQFNKLVSAADEGSEEAVKSMLKVLLSSIEISMKNNPDKDDSKIIEEHNIPIEECSKQVKQEKEEVKKLCEIKVCLVRSKKLKNLDNIDDYIKTLKKFLVSVLEVSKSNIELRNELSNLEEKSNELRDKLRSGGECFKKILNNKESLEEIVKIIKSFQKKKEEEVKNKLVSFQKAKESFLYCLGETINELNKCCQELKTHTKEYAVRDEIIKGIRGMGEAFDSPIKIVNPIKLAVEIASVFNNCCKMSFCDKRSDEFKNYLQGEELNTFLFSETYNSLIEVIQENKGLDIKISLHVTKILDLEEGLREYKKLKTFNNRYEKVCNIVIDRND